MANPYWPHLSGLENHNHAEDGGKAVLADNLSGSFGEINIVSTSGANFVTNGSFTTNVTSWTAGHSATLSSVGGGESGNCLQIEENGEDNPAATQAGTGLVIGKRYRFSFYVKNGTGSSYYASVYCGGEWNGMPAQTDATSSWVKHSYYFNALATSWEAFLYHFATMGDATTVLFDTVELVREGTGVLTINSTQVVGAQALTQAALKADYTTGDLDTEAEIIAAINATNAGFNTLLAKIKTHGLLSST